MIIDNNIRLWQLRYFVCGDLADFKKQNLFTFIAIITMFRRI